MNHKYFYQAIFSRLSHSFLSIRRLTRSILLGVLLGFVSASPQSSLASDVVADYTAPIEQQAIILPTSSGAIQVNMRTPTAAGVSVSQFSRFDVDDKGVILANNRKDIDTQLAGKISANPYMVRGEADVLVNQVNSSDPSRLNGVVEVAGKKADVIIANPSGISVNGGSFLNANKTVLSTGQAIVQDGQLVGHQINQGQITIVGKGLDVRDGNYTALLARSTKINAEIQKGKGKLDIITGVNEVDENGEIIHSNPTPNDGNGSSFAIDTGKLGGMYAGSIRLVGTEQGLGINNAGTIQTNKLTLTSDGQLKNSGSLEFDTLTTNIEDIDNEGAIASARPIDLQLEHLENKGTIKTSGKLNVKVKKNLNNSGKLLSKTSVHINSGSVTNTGIVKSNHLLKIATKKLDNSGILIGGGEQSITADTVSNKGAIKSTGILSIDAKHNTKNTGAIVTEKSLLINSKNVVNDGNVISGGTQSLHANTLKNNGSIQSAENLAIEATDDFANGKKGNITTAKELILKGQKVTNAGNIVSSSKQKVIATKIDNQGSIQSEETLTIKATDNVANSKGGKISTTKVLKINSKKIVNVGDIISGGQQIITTGNIDNQGSIQSTDSLTIKATDNVANDKGGKIVTAKELTLNSKKIVNVGNFTSGSKQIITTDEINNIGNIQSIDNLTIRAADKITSGKGGKIATAKELTFNSKEIANAGDIVSGENQVITANRVSNSGNILSTGNLVLNSLFYFKNTGNLIIDKVANAFSHTLTNDGSIQSGDDLLITVTDGMVNSKEGRVTSKKLLFLNSKNIANDGNIASVGKQTITTGKIDNKGNIHSEDDLTVKSTNDLINGSSANITTAKVLMVNSKNLSNNGNVVSGSNQGIITGKLSNTGNILSSKDLIIKATDNLINAKAGKVTSGNILSLDSKNLANNGDIISNANQTITTSNIDNDGNIQSTQDLTIKATGDLSNAKGSKITSGKLLTLNSKNVSNNGDIISGGNQVITTGKVDNGGNIQSSEGLITIKSTDNLSNAKGGKVTSGNTLTLNSKNVSNNGDIVSGGNQVITTGKVDNGGSIQSSEGLTIKSTDNLSNAKGGKVASGNTLTLNSKNVSNNGDIVSGGNQVITTGKVDNSGNIQSSQDLTIKMADDLRNAKGGKVTSSNTLTLNSKNVSNNGDIVSGGNQVITTGKVDNGGNIQSSEGLTIKSTDNLSNAKGGKVTSGNVLIINSKNVVNDGDIASGGNQTIATGKVDNKGSIQSLQGLTIKSTDDLSNAKGGKVTSGKVLTINSNNVANSGDIASGGNQTITSGEVGNGGNIQSTGDLTIKASDNLTNTKNSKITSGQVLILDSKNLVNDGNIISGDNQKITTGKVSNVGNIQSSKDLTIKAVSDVSNAKDSKIASGNVLIINSKNVANNGDVVSGGDQAITTGKIDNVGNIQSIGNLTVKATDDLTNAKGSGITSGKALTINSKNVSNNGDIVSGGDQAIATGKIDNVGNIQSIRNLIVKSTDDLTNAKGSGVTSGKALTINSKNVSNNGDIVSGGDQAITTGEINNEANIKSLGNLTIKALGFLKNSGKFIVEKTLGIKSQDLDNTGDIYSKGSQLLSTKDINNKGVIESSDKLTIDADTVNNNAVISGKQVEVTSRKDVVVSAGLLNGTDKLSITAQGEVKVLPVSTSETTETNSPRKYVDAQGHNVTETAYKRIKTQHHQGKISSNGDLSIKANKAITLKGGVISGQSSVSLESAENINVLSQIDVQMEETDSESSYTNADGHSVTEKTHKKVIDTKNTGSQIISNGDITLTAGNTYQQKGSVVKSKSGTTTISGSNYDITNTTDSRIELINKTTVTKGSVTEERSDKSDSQAELSLSQSLKGKSRESRVNNVTDANIKHLTKEAADISADKNKRTIVKDFIETTVSKIERQDETVTNAVIEGNTVKLTKGKGTTNLRGVDFNGKNGVVLEGNPEVLDAIEVDKVITNQRSEYKATGKITYADSSPTADLKELGLYQLNKAKITTKQDNDIQIDYHHQESNQRLEKVSGNLGGTQIKDTVTKLDKDGNSSTYTGVMTLIERYLPNSETHKATTKDNRVGYGSIKGNVIGSEFNESNVLSELDIQAKMTKIAGGWMPHAVAEYAEAQMKRYDAAVASKEKIEKLLKKNVSPADKTKLNTELAKVNKIVDDKVSNYDTWLEGGEKRTQMHAQIGYLLTGTEDGAKSAATVAALAKNLETQSKTLSSEESKLYNITKPLEVGNSVANTEGIVGANIHYNNSLAGAAVGAAVGGAIGGPVGAAIGAAIGHVVTSGGSSNNQPIGSGSSGGSGSGGSSFGGGSSQSPKPSYEDVDYSSLNLEQFDNVPSFNINGIQAPNAETATGTINIGGSHWSMKDLQSKDVSVGIHNNVNDSIGAAEKNLDNNATNLSEINWTSSFFDYDKSTNLGFDQNTVNKYFYGLSDNSFLSYPTAVPSKRQPITPPHFGAVIDNGLGSQISTDIETDKLSIDNLDINYNGDLELSSSMDDGKDKLSVDNSGIDISKSLDISSTIDTDSLTNVSEIISSVNKEAIVKGKKIPANTQVINTVISSSLVNINTHTDNQVVDIESSNIHFTPNDFTIPSVPSREQLQNNYYPNKIFANQKDLWSYDVVNGLNYGSGLADANSRINSKLPVAGSLTREEGKKIIIRLADGLSVLSALGVQGTGEGEKYRVAAYKQIGYRMYGEGGANGAEAISKAAPILDIIEKGIPFKPLKKAFSKIASNLIGFVYGGGDGARAATLIDENNRQLHTNEIDFLFNKNRILQFKEHIQEKEGRTVSVEEAEKRLVHSGVSLIDGDWSEIYGGDELAEAFIISESNKSNLSITSTDGKTTPLFGVDSESWNDPTINLRQMIEAYYDHPNGNKLIHLLHVKVDNAQAVSEFRKGLWLGYNDAGKEATLLGDLGHIGQGIVNTPVYIKDSVSSDQVGPIDSELLSDYYIRLLKIQGKFREAGYFKEKNWADTQRLTSLGLLLGETGLVVRRLGKLKPPYKIVVDPNTLSSNGLGGFKIVKKTEAGIPTTKIYVDIDKSSKGTVGHDLINGKIQGNAYYELSNGTTFKTNADGFVDEISFKPDFDNKGVRTAQQTQVGKLGKIDDVGGHIQSCAMGGTCDRYNLFPQNANFNNSAYKKYYENKVTKANTDGQKVENVTVKFTRNDPSSPRPDKLEVTFTIDGKKTVQEFDNLHGGGIQ